MGPDIEHSDGEARCDDSDYKSDAEVCAQDVAARQHQQVDDTVQDGVHAKLHGHHHELRDAVEHGEDERVGSDGPDRRNVQRNSQPRYTENSQYVSSRLKPVVSVVFPPV